VSRDATAHRGVPSVFRSTATLIGRRGVHLPTQLVSDEIAVLRRLYRVREIRA